MTDLSQIASAKGGLTVSGTPEGFDALVRLSLLHLMNHEPCPLMQRVAFSRRISSACVSRPGTVSPMIGSAPARAPQPDGLVRCFDWPSVRRMIVSPSS